MPLGATERADGPAGLVARVRAGEVRALARLLSLVEEGGPELPEALRLLGPARPGAHVIGVTGAPGVGKSTTVDALVGAYRQLDRRVAVVAVDPSSPFSGGALLGDRVRMTGHTGDPGVYVRSMASRGNLGGLARATPQVLRVLAAAGFDVVVLETVGVGQAEVDVAALADTVLVLLAPGLGDGIQAAKAGVLEIADVLVVNKADHPGAGRTVREMRQALGLAARPEGAEAPPVLRTVATSGEGIAELVAVIDAHAARARTSGEAARRARARVAAEIVQLAVGRIRETLDGRAAEVDRLAGQVLAGDLDPYTAADRALAAEPPTAP